MKLIIDNKFRLSDTIPDVNWLCDIVDASEESSVFQRMPLQRIAGIPLSKMLQFPYWHNISDTIGICTPICRGEKTVDYSRKNKHKYVIMMPIGPVGNIHRERRWRNYVVNTRTRKFVNMGPENGAIFESCLGYVNPRFRGKPWKPVLHSLNMRVDNDGDILSSDRHNTITFKRDYPEYKISFMVRFSGYKETPEGIQYDQIDWGLYQHGPDSIYKSVQSIESWNQTHEEIVIDFNQDFPMAEDDLMFTLFG